MRSKPGVARERDRAGHVGGIVRAAERGEHVRRHRLHAEAQPVHAAAAVRGELRRVDAVGIALDGHLGVVGAVDRVEDPHELIGRAAATACRHRRTRSSRPDSPRRGAARGRRRTRRRTRRRDGRDRSTSRSRSSRSAPRRTGCARRRRTARSRCSRSGRCTLRLRRPARSASAATSRRRPRSRP